ncbi:BTAD domain-containing putative transcriptional regulator [Dactylosporangium vinaceum]
MDARLLGPLTVSDGEATIDVPSGRQRALLAALLLNAGRPLSVDHLIEVLWDAEPPANARAALRTYMMRLRRTLGPRLGARIQTRPQGYLIVADENEVDVLRFQRHYATARAAANEQDWPTVIDQLRRALDLWRGEPLAEVPSPVLRERELQHLEQLHLRARELYFDAQLAVGRHEDVVLDLQRAVEAFPMREQSWAQLIIALYRSRRKADALLAFQTVRAELVRELGVEPGPDLQRLHQAVLNDDEHLLGSPAAGGAAPGGPGAALPPPPLPPAVVPRQLPPAHQHFTGRVDGLQTLDAALSRAQHPEQNAAPVVVIVGISGIGKTALALHWAHRVADRFPDGQLFINLHGFDTADRPLPPEVAIQCLLTAFGMPDERIPAGLAAQSALLRSTLAGKRVLLILDNAGNEEQVSPLLPGEPGCLTIVTSRNQLRGLLVSAGAQLVSLPPLTVEETVEVMQKRIGARRLAAEPEHLDRLVALCERIPLAAGILASTALAHPTLSIAELIGLFEEMPSPLDRFETGDTATSVRTLLTGSYRHLTPDGQRLLRRLALHHGGRIGHAAAAQLADLSVPATRRACTDLVRNHLLDIALPGQYTMHDLIRSFALETVQREESRSECREATARVLNYYLRTLHRAAELLVPERRLSALAPPPAKLHQGPVRDDGDGGAWYEANRGAITAAIRHATGDGFPDYCWRLAERAAPFLERLGRWHTWHQIADCALEGALRLGDPLAEATARLELGGAGDALRLDDAETLGELLRALDLFTEVGSLSGQATAHHRLALFHGRRDHATEFRHHCERAHRLHEVDDNADGVAAALNSLGWFSVRFDDFDTATTACQEAIAIYARTGNRPGEADSWDSLAWAYQRKGDLAAADACYQRVLPLDEALDRIGHRYHIATTQRRYGDLRCALGDQSGALDYWRRAQRTFDELNHPDREIVRQRILASTCR